MKQNRNSKLLSIQTMWQNTQKPGKLDIALLLVLLGLSTLFFLYGDICVTIEHSFNFIDSVLQGNLRGFYQIALENSSYGHPAVYDIPLYLIFAIWNLPIYILKHVADVSYMSFPCLLWSKLLVIVFVGLAGKVIYSIAEALAMPKDRCKWVVFTFLTSAMLVIPTFVIAQYDIISIFFSLLGIKAFIKKDEKWFIIWFLFANTMKLFSVFIFIPLLLLREKRIIPICYKAVLSMLGVVACKMIYIGDVAYTASTKSFTQDMIDRIQGTNIVWNQGIFCIPFFLIVLILVCILAYRKHCTDRELEVFAVYIPLVVFSAFCSLAIINPYWLVLLAPYTALMMFITETNLKLNMILDAIIGFVSVILASFTSVGVLSVFTMQNMLIGKIFPIDSFARRFYGLNDLLNVFHLQKFGGVFVAILFACLIAFLILNFPKTYGKDSSTVNREKIERGVVWLHAAVPCVIAFMICVVYMFPAPHVAIDETGDSVDGTVNILEADNSVTQKMTFDQDVEMDMVEIDLTIENSSWIDTSSIWLSIAEESDYNHIYSKRIAVNSIQDGTAKFKCKDLTLKKGTDYYFSIYGQDGEENPVYIKMTKDINEYTTYESGRQVDRDISLKVYGEARS